VDAALHNHSFPAHVGSGQRGVVLRRNTRLGLGGLALALTIAVSACGTTDSGGGNEADRIVAPVEFPPASDFNFANYIEPANRDRFWEDNWDR